MSSIGDSLPEYERVGRFGEPPEYRSTDSATDHRTRLNRHMHVAEDDIPPTYESLFGQIKEEWLTSNNFVEFLRNATPIFLASLECTFLLCFLLVLPVTYIVIGIVYIDDCPVNRMIPLYLVVIGVLGLLHNGMAQLMRRFREKEFWGISCRIIELLLVITSIIWFLLGKIWVYSSFDKVCFDATDSTCYCHPVCYWFTFVIVTIVLAIIVILLLSTCIVLVICIRWFGNHRDTQQLQRTAEEYEEIPSAAPHRTGGITEGLTPSGYKTLQSYSPGNSGRSSFASENGGLRRASDVSQD